MPRRGSYHPNPDELRYLHRRIFETSDQIIFTEAKLIELLFQLDQKRGYVWIGYNSMLGYCKGTLHLPKTQSQRLVTQVRRFEPRSNFCNMTTRAHPVLEEDR